jgi:hypothetical protein
MYTDHTTHGNSIADHNMTRYRSRVCKYAPTTHNNVVRDMCRGHEKISIPDSGNHPPALSTWLKGDKFSNRISIPYFETAWFTPKLKVLRRSSN